MDAIIDAQEYLQKKQSILYRAKTIRPGESFDCGGFVFFRSGERMGAAIPTGDTLLKIHNVHPGRSYSLDSDDALPRVAGNWLALTIDTSETDISDPVYSQYNPEVNAHTKPNSAAKVQQISHICKRVCVFFK